MAESKGVTKMKYVQPYVTSPSSLPNSGACTFTYITSIRPRKSDAAKISGSVDAKRKVELGLFTFFLAR